MPTVYSKRNQDTGSDYLGNCTLVMGDGTQKVTFENGRAEVPEALLALVALHPHVEVVGHPHSGVVEALPAQALAADGETVLAPEPAAVEASDVSDAVKAAIEHLEADGEAVPTVEAPATPAGFEALTGDGQPRCQAPKSDGSQCSNPASDGERCNLPKHRPAAE